MTQNHPGLTILIQGAPDSGKTTTASLIRDALKDNGYKDIRVADLPELPHDQKAPMAVRLERTRSNPVTIRVEVVSAGEALKAPAVVAPARVLGPGEVAPDDVRCPATRESSRCRLFVGHETQAEDGGGHRYHWASPAAVQAGAGK